MLKEHSISCLSFRIFNEESEVVSESGEKKLNAPVKKIEQHQIEKVGLFIRKTAGIEK
jgi:hypothetical protein